MMKKKMKDMKQVNFRDVYRTMVVVFLALFLPGKAMAQVDWLRALSSAWKVGQAITITDEQLAEMVKDEVAYLDKPHPVL